MRRPIIKVPPRAVSNTRRWCVRHLLPKGMMASTSGGLWSDHLRRWDWERPAEDAVGLLGVRFGKHVTCRFSDTGHCLLIVRVRKDTVLVEVNGSFVLSRSERRRAMSRK